jgi:dTDP-L-rhamnose 4-epimerase
MRRVLVTGGAGFIGSHLVDLLLEEGNQVTVLDSLEEQVHGRERKRPDYLSKDAELVVDDILNRKAISKLLGQADAVVHLAAMVGVGQSMYQIDRYVNVNTRGTALLLDILVNESTPVKKLVVASSMSAYGEGKYYCTKCNSAIYPPQRSEDHLSAKNWDHLCPRCGIVLSHMPTGEETPLAPTSIYAMSKRHQEEMCLLTGKAYSIPTVAMRFFNVYGPRQALSNPYTGVCAIFSSRILNGKPPFIFEDGQQLRDFIHVRDVARACVLALDHSQADYMPINVGTGRSISILEIARTLIELYGKELQPVISQEFRKGDIRHCYPDITRAERLLGFKPEIQLREGLTELSAWAGEHGWGSVDLFDRALSELKKRELA